jgi:hypothetical protein
MSAQQMDVKKSRATVPLIGSFGKKYNLTFIRQKLGKVKIHNRQRQLQTVGAGLASWPAALPQNYSVLC